LPEPLTLGDAFVIGDGGHLWIVCSVSDRDRSIVILNLTTWRAGCDENCVINPGEHSFVKHRSVVSYEHGRIATLVQQDKLRSIASSRAPATDALVSKIQVGAIASDLTSQDIQEHIRLSTAKQTKPR